MSEMGGFFNILNFDWLFFFNCCQGDVLMTTVSVYMMDRDQPLPQSDEILMCTSNTTKDEVRKVYAASIYTGAVAK